MDPHLEKIIAYSKENPIPVEALRGLYASKNYPFRMPEHFATLKVNGSDFTVGYWHEKHDNLIMKRLNVGYPGYTVVYPKAMEVNSILKMFGFKEDLNNFVMGVDRPQELGPLGYTETPVFLPYVYIPTFSSFGRRMNIVEMGFPLTGLDTSGLQKWLSFLDVEISKYKLSPKPIDMPKHNHNAIGYGMNALRIEIIKALSTMN